MAVSGLEQRISPMTATMSVWQPWGLFATPDFCHEEMGDVPAPRAHSWSGYSRHPLSAEFHRQLPEVDLSPCGHVSWSTSNASTSASTSSSLSTVARSPQPEHVGLAKEWSETASPQLRESEGILEVSPLPPQAAPIRDAGAPGATTMMLLNLPHFASLQELVDALETCGFRGKFDFCHLPCNLKTNENQGFAFVNFVSPAVALQFKRQWHLSREQMARPGSGPVRVQEARVQGLEACLRMTRKKARKVRSRNYKPALFAPLSAQE